MKWMRHARAFALLLAAVSAWWIIAAASAGTDLESRVPLGEFPRERIAVESGSIRRHLFEAWRADSPQTREQGFMFVADREVRPDQAMIFVYETPQYVAMWMKNTLLPLDMLFVDEHGCVVTIRQNAKPGSLAQIESRVPVALVVELKAGTVAAQGMAVGDRVVRLDAGWPADDVACTAPR